jgi:predicted secreted protein
MSLWPRTKIVRGRPRHPQSQGSVERGNAILKTKLAKWMEYNRNKRWTEGLPVVTHAMNVSVCRVTNCTPYELVFNKNPRTHYTLLDDFDENDIISEEQLNISFEENPNTDFEETDSMRVNTGNLVEAEAKENDEHSDEEVCWKTMHINNLYLLITDY